jgi:hypothetical protein
MKLRAFLPVLLLSSAFAQTPAYTTSVSFGCNQETCNGIPLDQGGFWQFIELNQAFSIYSNGFYIYGNPGNPGSGGMSNINDQVPEPPLHNGAVGAEGTITFTYAAVNSDRSLHYTGHVYVTGHEVKHCNQHGCWDQLIVDGAQIYIDSVQ